MSRIHLRGPKPSVDYVIRGETSEKVVYLIPVEAKGLLSEFSRAATSGPYE